MPVTQSMVYFVGNAPVIKSLFEELLEKACREADVNTYVARRKILASGQTGHKVNNRTFKSFYAYDNGVQ